VRLTKSFSIKGDVNRAFELAEKYVQGLKFSRKIEIKPTLLVLERGNGARALANIGTTKIKNAKTTLSISFRQNANDVIILCDYDISAHGIVLASDKSTLEREVEKLQNFLIIVLGSGQKLPTTPP
jgi:L-lactate utilization protein LutC